MDSYKYSQYIEPIQETRWATMDEIKTSGTYINVSQPTCPVGGLPLISNGTDVYVDSADTHTLIFGSTGSKKTRLFCMPMINIFAKAGESFVATDPKGELYAKTSGLVKSMGYKTIVLNFRDIGMGDSWNPFYLPYALYHSGQQDAATSMLNDFISALAASAKGGSNQDPFWVEMAASLALANALMLMECGTEAQANVENLAVLCSGSQTAALRKLAKGMTEDSIAGLNYKNVYQSPEKTLNTIQASLYSMLRVFNTQKQLSRMLSGNSVDLRRIGREKTAVYLIIPDEKTTQHFLAASFVKQAYELMITEAQREENFQLPVRVNFVLDEFCNMPKFRDMPAMISAARSRNMRFYLVAQSMHQLRGKYGEDADTIKGNCDNWVFLTSKELTLLNEISQLCGNIRTGDNTTRSLISISELQRLNKERGEALILHCRQYPFISELADISQYKAFEGFSPVPLKNIPYSESSLFTAELLLQEVERGATPWPFRNTRIIEQNKARLIQDIIDDNVIKAFTSK